MNSESAGQHGQIFVVDDEPRNVKILEELLEDYALDTAASGEECLEKLETALPDIILLDIMMPGIDGYEVCRQVKADKRFAFTKVILVSGKAMLEERLMGYEAGADDYITKPFDMDELRAKVGIFLRLKTAEHLNALKEDFLALVCHETRTPMNGILGFSDLILDNEDLSPSEIREYVTIIKKCGKDFLNLSDQILLYCELISGRQFQMKEVAAGNLLEDLFEELHLQSAAVDVTINQSVEQVALVCDQEYYRRAVRCIVRDALRRAKQSQVIDLKAFKDESIYVFEVRAPTEINEEEIKAVMSDFETPGVSKRNDLRGIGLAAARIIIEKHEGSLNIGTSDNGGCVYRLTLPHSES